MRCEDEKLCKEHKMISLIERQLKLAKEATTDKNTPAKYRKIAKKDMVKLEKELDKIYKMYSEIRRYEESVCKQFDIETF